MADSTPWYSRDGGDRHIVRARVMRVVAVAIGAALLAGCCCRRAYAPVVPAPREEPRREAPRALLPPGCSRLSDGSHALLAPDGGLLVFARLHTMEGRPVPREMTEYYYDHGSEPLIPRLVVRDLATGVEAEVPGWTSADADGVTRDGERLPVAWIPGGAIVLADGAIIDPKTGIAVAGVTRPPAKSQSWAWTRNGRRIAYVSEGDIIAEGGTPERAIFVADDGGATRRVDLSHLRDGRPSVETSYPDWLGGATLAWSPDGETLFLRLRYIRVLRSVGPDDVERVGLYSTRDGNVVLLSESTAADRAPERTVGEDVWDAAGRRCVFIATTAARPPIWGMPWAGTMDVVLAEEAGKRVRRVTTDGIEKGRPCIDSAGKRVAFFVGERAGRAWGAAGTAVKLRVIDVESGATWDSPLAPPPDGGAPLGTLRWMPDGRRVFYTYDGVYGASFVQDVPLVLR